MSKMLGDHEISVDVLNLSVIDVNDEKTIIVDNECIYDFYKFGESIDDAAMRVKIQLAEYRQVLDCLNQHGVEHESMRSRLSKISQRKLTVQSKNKCQVCNIPINLENSSDFITCSSCNHTICRNRHCAIWKEQSSDWNCKLCCSFLNGSNSACDWLISQLNVRLLQGKGVDDNFHNKIVWDNSNSNDNSPLIPLEQREKVREFIEELVSTLVGGSIDNAPVSQLYETKECLPTGENETDSIDRSHTNLKHLVERIIEEVFKIPDIFDHSGVPSQTQRINLPQFDPKKYEELLATAVLNKIVESSEKRFENSSGIHSGSDLESNTNTAFPKAELETISTSSSNEPRSDDSSNPVSLTDQPMSLTITNYIENLSPEHSPIDSRPQSPHSVGSSEEAYLSDYIQKHTVPLPSIDADRADSDSLDDDYQSLNSNDTEGNWQENWLFKKRKLKNETSTAIGMLVPSPMEEVKALIGDKTTDEVSDLSEAGSDIDDDEKEQVNGRNSADLPHALIESKTIIGGKNEVESFGEVKTIDELLQPDSLVSIQSINNQSPIIMEAKNDLILMSESDSNPVVLHLSEKVTSNDSKELSSSIVVNEDISQQQESSEIPESVDVITNEISEPQGTIGLIETEEPPIPTPRRKSKSFEATKQRAVSVDENPALALTASFKPPVLETKKSLSVDNNAVDGTLTKTIDNQALLTKIPSKLEDELLDLSINNNKAVDAILTKSIDNQTFLTEIPSKLEDEFLDLSINDNKAVDASLSKSIDNQTLLTEIPSSLENELLNLSINDNKTVDATLTKTIDNQTLLTEIPSSLEDELLDLSINDNKTVDATLTKTIDNQTLLTEIPSNLEDELLDLSINDIYQSIEGISTLDYQSLVADDDKVTNESILLPDIQPIIFKASNPFIEDCLTETTQDIGSEKVITEPPFTEFESNFPNESYICKVNPTEYDLSMDNVFQPKSDVLDVILPNEKIEDNTVPKAVYISSKPALIAVEIASHHQPTSVEITEEFSVKNDQTPSIPTFIISNSITDTESDSPPIVTSDDNESLQPKKVLKKQHSLELPKDDRGKFQPVKRVDSIDTNGIVTIDAKLGALENIVNSVADYVKNNPEDSLEVAGVDVDRNDEKDESFIIVTEEEKEALKVEEQESMKKSDDQITSSSDVDNVTIVNTLEKLTVLESSEENDNTSIDLKPSERYRTYANIQMSAASTINVNKLSTSHLVEKDETVSDESGSQDVSTSTFVTELPSTQELPNAPSVIAETVKTTEVATPTTDFSPSLISIVEVTSDVETVTQSETNNTSKLFTTNETITLSSATNTLELNEYADLPGSIAEREHLKWKNAQDIPNNPYSAEALQRRLSQTKNQSKIIDVSHLATKQIDDQGLTPDTDNGGKSLQIVLGAGMPDHLRYGRDYYINDAKNARGTRKQTASFQQYSSTEEDNISSKPTTPDSEIFTAKIVQIKEDPGHLSDDSIKLKLSISNNSSPSIQSDSLTLSDDSESTRVYDLRKNETVYLRNDIIRTSRNPIGAAVTVTPPPTPSDGDITLTKNLDQFFAIKQLNQLKLLEEQPTSQIKSQTFHTKPLSPDTVKFLAPKPKPVFTSRIRMEEVISIKPLVLERENVDIPQNGATEKAVIEEDVILSLPSVKALAKTFLETKSTENTNTPIQRPKSFTWQVSKESGNNNGFVKEPSPDSYIPLYQSTYHPVGVGHSITARSLSTKFREELRHSTSDDTSNGTDNIEIVERQRDHSPDRPPSPVLLKGIFKEKISFFKNLETK